MVDLLYFVCYTLGMNFQNKLKNLLHWFKYFCFNFFHNGYAREGAKRSILNFLLGAVIAFAIICGGLTIGYNSSLHTHYQNAVQFRQFVDFVSSKAEFSLKDGKLTSDSVIETLSDEDSAYRMNGYELVIDTRPAAETFDDFTIICKDGEGHTIDYDDYAKLSASEKKKYSLTLKYSGKTLDPSEKSDIYRAYLDEISDPSAEKYDAGIAASYAKIKEREASGEDSAVIARDVYKLYAKAYYPSFQAVERYASVPTVRSYYISELSNKKSGQYLVLFNEAVYCSFYTDGGIAVSISSRYTLEGGTAELDGLIEQAIKSYSSSTFLIFVSDMVQSVLVFVVLMMLVSFACSMWCKKSLEYAKSPMALFNIMGGFLPVSGIIAFIFGVSLPYALTIRSAYFAVRLIFLFTVIVRFAIFLAMELVKAKKNPPKAPEAAGTAEPSEPFEDMSGEGDGALVELPEPFEELSGEADNPPAEQGEQGEEAEKAEKAEKDENPPQL